MKKILNRAAIFGVFSLLFSFAAYKLNLPYGLLQNILPGVSWFGNYIVFSPKTVNLIIYAWAAIIPFWIASYILFINGFAAAAKKTKLAGASYLRIVFFIGIQAVNWMWMAFGIQAFGASAAYIRQIPFFANAIAILLFGLAVLKLGKAHKVAEAVGAADIFLGIFLMLDAMDIVAGLGIGVIGIWLWAAAYIFEIILLLRIANKNSKLIG